MDAYDEVVELMATVAKHFKVEREDDRYSLFVPGTIHVGERALDNVMFAQAQRRGARVRFEFMPVYTHPETIIVPEGLERTGKACFYLTDSDTERARKLLKQGLKTYRDAGWIQA